MFIKNNFFVLVKPLICEIEKLRLKKNDFEIRKTIGRGHFGEVFVSKFFLIFLNFFLFFIF